MLNSQWSNTTHRGIKTELRFADKEKNSFSLKALIQPSWLACVISWLAFVVVVFMGHENGENNGQQRDDTSKA